MTARTATVPPGEFITAMAGFHEVQFQEGRMPILDELYEAAPNHPVYLQQGFNGPSVASTLGKTFFEAAGLVVDPDGSLSTGPAFAASLAEQTIEDSVRGTRELIAHSSSVGLTMVMDTGGGGASPGTAPWFDSSAEADAPALALWRDGGFTVRVRPYFISCDDETLNLSGGARVGPSYRLLVDSALPCKVFLSAAERSRMSRPRRFRTMLGSFGIGGRSVVWPPETALTMGIYRKYVLPRIVDLACGTKPAMKQREKVVPLARGRVLEIGIGSGLNLPFYDAEKVEHIWGLDPSQEMWSLAKTTPGPRGVEVEFVEAPAEGIPLDDACADTVLITYTLCTIPDVRAALEEMRRVLKPDGRLVFCEHGLAPDPGVRKWQHRVNPLWKRLGGGCNLNRPIPELIESAGFRIRGLETMYIPGWRPASFNYWGTACP